MFSSVLQLSAIHVIQLIGADSAKEKRLALQKLLSIPTSETLVIVATGKYVLHDGVDVAIRIKEEGVNEMELANAGIDVVCCKEQTLQCAIIDKSIVWYGNINFFGYNSETNNVMRIVDYKIANEMIEILYSESENDANGG